MGMPKQLLMYEGRTLVERALAAAVCSQCDPVVLVLGANATAIKERISDTKAIVVENSDWKSGLSSSLKVGINCLLNDNNGIAGALILACDQPFITTPLIDDLVNHFERDKPLIVASRYDGTAGIPALFSRELFDELTELTGDKGAKGVIAKHGSQAILVDLPEGALDIDTPEDYKSLCEAKP
jgi:molybdenum cofactor cytidylyltransferase